MKGRLIDFSTGYNRKQRITLEIESDFREGYEALKEAELEISIKKWRRKRSKDANAYFHVLVNAIAEARGVSDEEGTVGSQGSGVVLQLVVGQLEVVMFIEQLQHKGGIRRTASQSGS